MSKNTMAAIVLESLPPPMPCFFLITIFGTEYIPFHCKGENTFFLNYRCGAQLACFQYLD